MHVGRIYPFHPMYWGTECWFWPNFIPWKLQWGTTIGQDPPWTVLTLPQLVYSGAGLLSTDRKTVEYQFIVNTTHGPEQMSIFSFKEIVAGVQMVRRELRLSDGGVPTWMCFRRDVMPASSWSWGAYAEGVNLITGDPIPVILGSQRYAKYDEVGSPFPNY